MMNRKINENQKRKYTLEDAYNIINSIINDEREKYENIINTMNNKIKELKLEIEQLKEENKIYKNKIFQFQNQFYSLSKTFYQLNETPQKDFLKNNNLFFNLENNTNQGKEIMSQIPNEISQKINLNQNNDSNISNNNIFNTDINTQKSSSKLKNSIRQQLFNKKLIKKMNYFNLKKNKNISINFNNKIDEPIKVAQRNNNSYIKQNYSQNLNDLNELNEKYYKDPNKTISYINNFNNGKKILDNYDLQSYTYKKQNTQKEKFNIIEKKIKKMKNGLSIYKAGRNKFSDDNNEFSRTKYDTYSINNMERRINCDINGRSNV